MLSAFGTTFTTRLYMVDVTSVKVASKTSEVSTRKSAAASPTTADEKDTRKDKEWLALVGGWFVFLMMWGVGGWYTTTAGGAGDMILAGATAPSASGKLTVTDASHADGAPQMP